jgi:ribose 5-phosphate isomerase B
MRIGFASDHGGFALKETLEAELRLAGHEIVDFGAYHLTPDDDYPDFIIPLAKAVAAMEIGLIHDVFSARQGVEDDDMNVFCLGGRVIGSALALVLVTTFLAARFSGAPRHRRRLMKVRELETFRNGPSGH